MLSDKQICRLAYLYRKHRLDLRYGPHRDGRPSRIERICRTHRSWVRLQEEVGRQQGLVNLRRARLGESADLRAALRACVERRIAALVEQALPEVSGAGRRYVTVSIDPGATAPEYAHSTSYGDRNTVARRYRYPVIDHHHTLTLAPSHRVLVEGGIITIVRRSEYARTGCRAWWLVRSTGYSHRVVEGWLVRGVHVRARSLQAAQRRVAAQRSATAANLWRKRTADAALRRVWVSREDSLAAGNCAAGTDNFVDKISRALGGTPGAVRADWLIDFAQSVGELFRARRAVSAALARYGY